MDIGAPRRIYTIEPLEEPVPPDSPAPEEPTEQPAANPAEPEPATT